MEALRTSTDTAAREHAETMYVESHASFLETALHSVTAARLVALPREDFHT